MNCGIRGILLDSGDTLVRPKAGSWWSPEPLKTLAEEHGVTGLNWPNTDASLKEGMDFLDAHHHVMTANDERRQFAAFYEIVLRALGLPNPPVALISALADAQVDDIELEPFPETRRVLEALRGKGLRLAVVSNAWPSLEVKYERLGLRGFFDVFVISSRIGCCKPDPRIYEAAIAQMNLPRQNLLFVDDCAEYVREANRLGLRGIMVLREGGAPAAGLEGISNLEQLIAVVTRE